MGEYFFADDWKYIQEERRQNQRGDEQDEEENNDMVNINWLTMLLDEKLQNEVKDNALYYIAVFTVKSLLKLECGHFKDKLLLHVEDDGSLSNCNLTSLCKTNLLQTDTQPGISFTCCVEKCKGHRNGIATKGIR